MWSIPDFPFFRNQKPPLRSSSEDPAAAGAAGSRPGPVLGITLDRKIYRPGDAVTATVEIRGATDPAQILLEDLVVEFGGAEKLDPQWVITPKQAVSGKKLKRGERIFFQSRGHVVAGELVEGGSTKSYLVRITLPKVLPPSYRGTAVRYFYYLTARVPWNFVSKENGISSNGSSSRYSTIPLEKRVSLTVWTMPNNSGLTAEEFQHGFGSLVPLSLIEVEMHWKENDEYSEWSRAANIVSAVDDDVSSQGSESVAQSPVKGSLENTFDRMILLTPKGHARTESLGRTISRPTLLTASFSEQNLDKGQRSSQNSQKIVERSASGSWSPWNRTPMDGYPSEQEEDSPLTGYMKGKAYNIRLDDEVLVRISPKSPDAVHYFGDTVAGVVSFPDDIGLRKCVEITAVLEVREIVNPSHLHPSRRNSQVISKVQSEYHEIVADVSQTHYLFSIPLDGPPSFSTPYITVQWILRFEFVAVPANVDWTIVSHPLQVRERERGEWNMPITVHAPLPRAQAGGSGGRKDRPVTSLRDFWIQSPKAPPDWTTPQGSPLPAAGPSNGHI